MEEEQNISRIESLSPRDFMSLLGLSSFSVGERMEAFGDAVNFCSENMFFPYIGVWELGTNEGMRFNGLGAMKAMQDNFENKKREKKESLLDKSAYYRSVFDLTVDNIGSDYGKAVAYIKILNRGEKIRKKFETLTKGVDESVLPEMCDYVVSRGNGYNGPRVNLDLIGGRRTVRKLEFWASWGGIDDKIRYLVEVAKMKRGIV